MTTPPSKTIGAASLTLLVVIAVAISGRFALFLDHRIPRALDVSTDVIGYPIFNAFNPYIYEQRYQLAVVVFPATTLAVLLALIWLWRRARLPLPALGRRRSTATEACPAPVTRGWMMLLGSLARVLVVGLVLGLATAVGRGDQGPAVIGVVLGIAILYCAILGAAAFLGSRRAAPAVGMRLLARANALGAVASLTGIWVASQATQVSVAADHSLHHYAWFPSELAAPLIAGALLVTLWAFWRGRGRAVPPARMERRLVYLVAVPVGLFLLLASLQGEIPQFAAFEWGQSLTTLRLVQHGAFPWRDFVTTHGLLDDVIQPLLASTAIQDSNWGIMTGPTLFVIPACSIALYYLAYRLLGNCWPFLLLLGFLFFDRGYSTAYLRFGFWPLVLILMGVVIDRRRPWLAMLLGGALMVQALLSPETAYCIPAVGIAVLASDAYRTPWRQRDRRLRGFAMTLWTMAGGALVALVLVVILTSQHALADFIRYYTAFVPGHILSGGVPHLPLSGYYLKMAVIPVLAMLSAMALLTTRVLLGRRLKTLDWMLVAATVLEFLYYPKFLDRADLHVGETFVPAIPLLLILTALLLDELGPVGARLSRARVSARTLRYAVGAAAVLVVALTAPVSAATVITDAPAHFRLAAAAEERIPSLGYAKPNAIDPRLLTDLERFITAYMGPRDHLFDFTNEPGLLYYLLDFQPSTPYYNISVATRDVIQQDVVERLRADRPLFVIFAQGEAGLPVWDGIPNMVRHYAVSQYLLAHYRPFADVHGQVIYVDSRRSVVDPQTLGITLSTPLITTDLAFRGPNCDWGYTPNFLSIAPSAPSPGHLPLTVSLTRESPTSYLMNLPPGVRWSDYQWLDVDFAGPRATDTFTLTDGPVIAREQRIISFASLAGRSVPFRFPIGACSQWGGYGSVPLQLAMATGQQISEIQLLP